MISLAGGEVGDGCCGTKAGQSDHLYERGGSRKQLIVRVSGDILVVQSIPRTSTHFS